MTTRLGRLATRCFLLAMLAATSAFGADPATGNDAGSGFVHRGVLSCAQSTCHGAVTPWLTSPIAQNEYFIWRDKDPHSGAYRVLGEGKARNIAAQMGIKDASQAPLCLGCHTDNVPVALRGPHFKIEDGITCETCHGGSEKWLGIHNLPDTDLATLPTLGMYPTNRVAERARLCVSCHEYGGSHDANHRLVSAGHPQFPDDLAAYLEKWPAHYTLSQSYIARKHPAPQSELNAAISVDQATDWAGTLAHSAADSHSMMLEFSSFHCDNCHRSTSQPDAQSTGTPRLNDAAIHRLLDGGAIGDSALREKLRRHLNDVDAAVARGDRQLYSAAANDLYQDLKTASRGNPEK